ncbi:isochorismatase domain-containing protein 2 isoform X2 [Petaurus breviceps papuanus]|uniref:isochorismatase domain-containing protein 2 isoform X2 n=1 Tax=Petaurus breviceps papuanus TaxID=3040969 RepID=UPI0036D96449
MAAARPALGRVLPGSSMLFLCDMQEKFRGTISFFPQIVAVSARMLQVARMLDIPVMLTEQYPKGLGPTVPELGAQGIRAVPKTCFSMVVPEVEQLMKARPGLLSVLLCGIEAQACVMSTALDLLERGLEVHVVADACSSRRWTACWLCPGCARAGSSLPPASASYCSWWAILPIRVSRRCRN